MTDKRKSNVASHKATQGAKAGEPPSQSERFIAKARELGLDEREEAFDAALTKVARHKALDGSDPLKGHKDN